MVANKGDTIARRQLAQIARNVAARYTRPTFLTEELFLAVCDEVAKGKSVKRCAREMGFCEASWRHCMGQDADLAERFALAKLEQANAMEDELTDIADDEKQETMRSKLRVDTRKWLMSKINPKKYGEKLEVDKTITHEVGDSVMGLLDSIRLEANAIEAQTTQPSTQEAEFEDVQTLPAPTAPTKPSLLDEVE